MRWNRAGEHRRPKILYLADRNILIDDPKDKMFTTFGDARWKIENGEVNKGREMYFAIYQAIAKDEHRPGLYKEYSKDFFDLIIVDECHRGSAKDESNWREILSYFQPAYQLGMTATPLRKENRDTYRYFGNPIYTYSLRQGIEDGFLAPYRVHRIVTEWDAAGWRPSQGDLDRYGREIPDNEYQTIDFERAVALKARTEAIARNITDFLKKTDRFAKTIVFCVDQEHADDMRRALNIAKLEERGIDFDQLRTSSNQPEADPFDLLCHLAFNGPLRTRRERADRVKKDEKSFFEKYGPEARAILADLLEKYAEHGTAQFVIPDVLKVPPISERGNVIEIAKLFGGPEELRDAVAELQALLYAA